VHSNTNMRRCHRVKIVSFSGIDGAGKTTQIQAFTKWLCAAGLRVQLTTFWDDVVVFSKFRERMSHKVFKGDQGIGSPEKPLNRRDKNVTSWPITAFRFFLYLCDALNVVRKIRQARKGDADVVIFDRYLYDELANLALERWFTRIFARLLLGFVPAPDVAYFLDAHPTEARKRKPEYPLDFIRKNREAYLSLSHLIGRVVVIEPLPIDSATLRVKNAFLQNLSAPPELLINMPAPQ
jgi:thymidylate kinase